MMKLTLCSGDPTASLLVDPARGRYFAFKDLKHAASLGLDGIRGDGGLRSPAIRGVRG